ncbi:MAG: Yip1 domain protein [Euryarchaeota archaeon ADurb.BinA087]|nr:MAG: Yip1 domain protein [Euryarchaeota archaeon ADurb.BinA087]HPX72662.1 Yip1 family protein [Methanoregulaceae archaeon]
MKGMLPFLLFRPDTFFSERMNVPEDLKIPGIIAVIGAIISAAGAYLASGVYSGLFSAAAGEGMAPVMGAVSALSAFFAFLILWWIIFAGIFYLLSMVFSGSGTFRRTLEFTGYGLVPVIIGLIISALVSLYYLPMVEVPVISNIQDPAAVQRFMNDILMDPAFREYTRISAVISVIFLAWSANLWIFGMKNARSLSIRNAIIVVLIPVIIFAIYTLYMAFIGMPFLGGP